MRLVTLAVLTSGCATQPTNEPTREPPPAQQSAEFERRLAQHPGMRLPGEAEAVERDVEHLVDLWPEDAELTPLMAVTEIRNRCAEPVTFVVGPEDATPTAESPTNILAAGEAIWTGMAGSEWVHGRAPDGSWSLSATAAGGWIVFTGDGPCTGVEVETR